MANYVESGAILGFKVGTQSRVNELLAAGTNAGASHGTFYLAQDTHRLYIGNEDTSLSPVNEGVTTVANMAALNTIATGWVTADQKAGAAGQFFYDTADNILCVWNGKGWVQINTNTNDTINSYTMAVESEDNNAGKVVKGTVSDTANHSYSARFKVTGDNGVVVSYDTTQVTINGTVHSVPLITVSSKYTLATAADGMNGAKIQLKSEDSSNDSEVKIVPGNYGTDTATNVTISRNSTTGDISIAAKDSKNKSVTVANNASAGFDVTITENTNATVTTNFQPKIQYGSTPITVDFVGGTATLNAYTKGEVDDLMRALNGMTYIGTLVGVGAPQGLTASAATAIKTDATTGNTTVELDGTNVPMHVGDTILVAYPYNWQNGAGNLSKGSLLIARGTEDANGEITPATLTFDVVESTVDIDTTYYFAQTSKGIELKDSANKTQGGLLFTGGTDTGTATNDLIKVSTSYVDTGNTANSKKATITIEHKDVTRTDTTGTAIETNRPGSGNGWQGDTVVTIITGVTTNESGHVTGVETKQITIHDTSAIIDSVTTSFGETNAGIYTNATTGANVGIFETVITEKTKQNQQKSVTNRLGFSSKSLTLTGTTQQASASNAASVNTLNIEMIWGSF